MNVQRKRFLCRRPSPAMMVACISLTIALSGASYAAVALPRNSVGTPQLKANAVKTAKVAANTLNGGDINEATLGPVPSAVNANSATSATNAANAANAENAGTLDTLDSTAFLRSTAAAGGDLAGSFPNPTIAPSAVGAAELADNAVSEAKVANGTLRLVDLAVWTRVGNIGGSTVNASSCAYFNFGTPSDGTHAPSDLIIVRSDAAVPTGLALNAHVNGTLIFGGACNFTTSNIALPNPFVLRIYGIR